MRALFIKILASLSLALGLLGPQVASGSQSVVNSQVPKTNASVLTVVSSVSSQEVVSHTSVLSDCGPVNSFLDRMDILIWQACGSITVTDEFDLPTLAVIDKPEFVPTVAVKTSDTNWIAQGTLNQVEYQDQSGLIPLSLLPDSKQQSKGVAYNQSNLSQSYSYIESSQNFFTNISMRC